MTIKEIAEAVGKDERSVQRWTKRLGDTMSSISDKVSLSSPTNPADYDLEETIGIIKIGLGVNASELFRQNAYHAIDVQTNSGINYTELATVVATAVVTAMTSLSDRVPAMSGYTAKEPKQLQLIPPKSDRAKLNQAVRKHAEDYQDGDYRSSWKQLYSEFYYRMSMNIRVRAEHAGMSKVEYLEAEGLIDTAIELLREPEEA